VDVDRLGNQIASFVTGEGLADIVSRTAELTTTIAIVIAFVFIGSIYLLAAPPNQFSRAILKLLPVWRRPAMEGTLRELEPQLRWWLIGTLIGMISIGIASYLGYTAIGLKWALPLAMFAALTEAIPTVGPAVTLLLGLLLASTQGASQIFGVIIVYAVAQGLESYVLIPLVMKSAVDIPPAVSLFTLILWGKVLGLAGLLLAIPIDLVIWSLLMHFVIQREQTVESERLNLDEK
jgi:predicted PurR-regulated permease PerM